MMGWISVLTIVAAFQPQTSRPPPGRRRRWPPPRRTGPGGPPRRIWRASIPATEAKVGGDVTLACNVAKAGGLSDCVVFRENPARYGFGEAALKIADTYWLRPERAVVWTALNRRVLVPVRFRMEGGDNPLPPGFVPRGGRTPMPERLRT